MLQHYTPIHDFRSLQEKLLTYTKNDDFLIAQQSIADLCEEVLKKADIKDVDHKSNPFLKFNFHHIF